MTRTLEFIAFLVGNFQEVGPLATLVGLKTLEGLPQEKPR